MEFRLRMPELFSLSPNALPTPCSTFLQFWVYGKPGYVQAKTTEPKTWEPTAPRYEQDLTSDHEAP